MLPFGELLERCHRAHGVILLAALVLGGEALAQVDRVGRRRASFSSSGEALVTAVPVHRGHYLITA
jgi:hypothetical protein